MQLPRRRLLGLAAAGVAAASLPRAARAFDYPVRPVRIFEGFGVGGTPDLISRLIGQWLSAAPGPTFHHREPDRRRRQHRDRGGRQVAAGRLHAAHLPVGERRQCLALSESRFQFPARQRAGRRTDQPADGVAGQPVVSRQDVSRIHRLRESQSGQGQHGVARHRNADACGGELIKLMAGVNMVHVPYRGPAGAFTDLIAGRVQAFIITVPAAIGFIRDGRLRALAVTSAKRAECCRTCRPSANFCPVSRRPPGTGPVRRKERRRTSSTSSTPTINAGLADPQLKAKIKDLGGETMSMTPAEFGKFLADETAKWAKVVKFSGAKPN